MTDTAYWENVHEFFRKRADCQGFPITIRASAHDLQGFFPALTVVDKMSLLNTYAETFFPREVFDVTLHAPIIQGAEYLLEKERLPSDVALPIVVCVCRILADSRIDGIRRSALAIARRTAERFPAETLTGVLRAVVDFDRQSLLQLAEALEPKLRDDPRVDERDYFCAVAAVARQVLLFGGHDRREDLLLFRFLELIEPGAHAGDPRPPARPFRVQTILERFVGPNQAVTFGAVARFLATEGNCPLWKDFLIFLAAAADTSSEERQRIRQVAMASFESNPQLFAHIFIGSLATQPQETATVLAQELRSRSGLLKKPPPALRAGILIVMRYMCAILTAPPDKFKDLVQYGFENHQEDLADFIWIAQKFVRAYSKNSLFRDGNMVTMLANSFYAKSAPFLLKKIDKPSESIAQSTTAAWIGYLRENSFESRFNKRVATALMEFVPDPKIILTTIWNNFNQTDPLPVLDFIRNIAEISYARGLKPVIHTPAAFLLLAEYVLSTADTVRIEATKYFVKLYGIKIDTEGMIFLPSYASRAVQCDLSWIFIELFSLVFQSGHSADATEFTRALFKEITRHSKSPKQVHILLARALFRTHISWSDPSFPAFAKFRPTPDSLPAVIDLIRRDPSGCVRGDLIVKSDLVAAAVAQVIQTVLEGKRLIVEYIRLVADGDEIVVNDRNLSFLKFVAERHSGYREFLVLASVLLLAIPKFTSVQALAQLIAKAANSAPLQLANNTIPNLTRSLFDVAGVLVSSEPEFLRSFCAVAHEQIARSASGVLGSLFLCLSARLAPFATRSAIFLKANLFNESVAVIRAMTNADAVLLTYTFHEIITATELSQLPEKEELAVYTAILERAPALDPLGRHAAFEVAGFLLQFLIGKTEIRTEPFVEALREFAGEVRIGRYAVQGLRAIAEKAKDRRGDFRGGNLTNAMLIRALVVGDEPLHNEIAELYRVLLRAASPAEALERMAAALSEAEMAEVAGRLVECMRPDELKPWGMEVLLVFQRALAGKTAQFAGFFQKLSEISAQILLKPGHPLQASAAAAVALLA